MRRTAFFKQVKFLEQNLHHPSLRAKKYDDSQDILAGPRYQGLAFLFHNHRRHLPH
jgi:hypothetical protein